MAISFQQWLFVFSNGCLFSVMAAYFSNGYLFSVMAISSIHTMFVKQRIPGDDFLASSFIFAILIALVDIDKLEIPKHTIRIIQKLRLFIISVNAP